MSLVSRTKNRHGHWVCWMSTGKRYGLTRRTHTHNGASHATLSIETPCKMRHHNPGESATHTLREEKTYWKYWKQNKRGQRITQLAKASFDIFSRRSAWSLTHGKYFCVPVARHEKQHELHHVETRMQLRFLVSTRNKPTGKSGNRTSTADTSRSLQRQVSTYISYLINRSNSQLTYWKTILSKPSKMLPTAMPPAKGEPYLALGFDPMNELL